MGGVANRLRAKAHSRGLLEFIEGSKAGLAARHQDIVRDAVGGPEELSFVVMLLTAFFTG